MSSRCTSSSARVGARGRGVLALLWALALAGVVPAQAIDWERLVMPGPVIAGHAKLEQSCKTCHAPFDREEQRGLCLDCHKAVASDITASRGFHGRHQTARTAQCRDCHTDHEGREADVVRLDPQLFDHAATDFRLEGAHRGLICGACHDAGQPHREAPGACIDCHADRDVHRTGLGRECARCHGVERWREVRFDHGKASAGRWPLTGAHTTVDCALCHAGERYRQTPAACNDCHRIDDVHAGQRGTACGDCHGTDAWKTQKFDHLRETGFALTHGHADVGCQACHRGPDMRQVNGKQCVDCHAPDDVHRGRQGRLCATCHTTARWSTTDFDHAKSTDFTLRGAHARLDCGACHKADARTGKLPTDCAGCHRADDVHVGGLGERCADCHGEERWSRGIRFDHDLTAFALVGLHAGAACEACHASRRFDGTPSACVDCHRADDAHRGHLGQDCAGCHTPNDWRLWSFDHDTRTDFPLDGAHDVAACGACHRAPPGDGAKLARDCAGCHQRDDVHGGEFGRDCSRCHDTRSFGGATRRSP